MSRLKMLRGPEPGQEFILRDEEITIGRGRKNTIIIQDGEVSRHHCKMVRVLDDYEIRDLKSTNGTFVNGQRITPSGWLLSVHCIVELGDSITFEYYPSELATGTSFPSVLAGNNIFEIPHYLVVNHEEHEQPEIYLLDRHDITLGRETDNDIVLRAGEVSRHHLRMLLTDEGYTIEDLGALNGTYLNGKRLERQTVLKPQDLVRIGTKLMMWYTNDPDGLLDQLENGEHPAPVETKTTTKAAATEGADPARSTNTNEVPQVEIVGHGLEPDELEDYVFMAYARSQWQDVVCDVFAYLNDNGVPIWVDQYLRPNTEHWNAAIEQAQSESKCLLAVISEEALKTTYVMRSLQHFLAREKPLLLLQISDVQAMPMMLRNLPVLRYDRENPQATQRTLMAELRKLDLL